MTNPAWYEMMGKLEETLIAEATRLNSIAIGPELAQINAQAGIREGVKRSIKRLESYKEEVLKDARDSSSPQGG